MSPKEGIFLKAKKFFVDPVSAFDEERENKTLPAFKYIATWLLLNAIIFGIGLTALLNWIQNIGAPALPLKANVVILPVAIFIIWISSLITVAVSGLWLHLWAYIVGARNGVENTLKTVFYGSTPIFVIGWIPIIGILGYIWSLPLQALGLTRTQGIHVSKSILAIVLAVGIPLIVFAAILTTSVSTILSMPLIDTLASM